MILPGKFSQISNEVEEADSYDVRQNLKTWQREENTDEYCVVFRVEKAMKACKLNEDTQSLVRGRHCSTPIIFIHGANFISRRGYLCFV